MANYTFRNHLNIFNCGFSRRFLWLLCMLNGNVWTHVLHYMLWHCAILCVGCHDNYWCGNDECGVVRRAESRHLLWDGGRCKWQGMGPSYGAHWLGRVNRGHHECQDVLANLPLQRRRQNAVDGHEWRGPEQIQTHEGTQERKLVRRQWPRRQRQYVFAFPNARPVNFKDLHCLLWVFGRYSETLQPAGPISKGRISQGHFEILRIEGWLQWSVWRPTTILLLA